MVPCSLRWQQIAFADHGQQATEGDGGGAATDPSIEGQKTDTSRTSDADQKFQATTMDTVIGRAAHVAMLDSPAVVLLVLFSLYRILR